jgi:Transposase DDE domain
MPLMEKLMICKRSIIETIIGQLKNVFQIEHSRHRSPVNFMVNLVCGSIAYCHQIKKPSLYINEFFLPAPSLELRLGYGGTIEPDGQQKLMHCSPTN